MWVGFAIALVHFLSIMMHATNPSIPTLSTHYDVGKLFTEKPLDALRSLFLFIYNPQLAGMAYFAPQDLCFSMWFFFVFWFKPIALFYRVAGYTPPSGFPFYWEQSAGAFVAIAIFYAWAGRSYLQRVLSAAWRGTWLPGEARERARGPTRSSYRLAVIGGVCGFCALCLWYMLAGMSWWVAGIFFFLIVLFAVIYTRGRAETGVASTCLVSLLAGQPADQVLPGLRAAGGRRQLLQPRLLGSLIYLHFGDYPEGMTYQIESLKLGEEVASIPPT